MRSLGNVDFRLLGTFFLVGSVPGIIMGSRLTLRVDQRYVRNAIAVPLAVVGGRLLLQR